MKTNVFIGIACYDDVKLGTAESLFHLGQQLSSNQIGSMLMFAKSPYVGKCRNMLVSAFLKTQGEYLLFIDADVGFTPDAVIKMIEANKQVICTLYRVKKQSLKIEYPLVLDNKDLLLVDDKDNMKIKVGPTGLMLIHRNVFESIIQHHPELKIKNEDDPFMYDFFNTVFKDGYWYGEDVSFCHIINKLGIEMYANIGSETTHYGTYGWTGTFKDVLKKKRIMIHYPLTDNLRSYAWKQVSIKNFGNRSQSFNGTKEKQYTGILGECVVHDLLKRELPTYDQGSVIADLVINNKKVDVKSMARNVDMQEYYVHNFVGYQKDTDCDVLLFININKKTGVAQICGWLPKQTFLEQANFFDKGSKRIRADGTSFITMAPLYEIENNKLNKITSIEDLQKI